MISLLFCLVSVSVSPSSSFSLGPGARGGEVAAFASRGAAVVPQSRSQWAEAEPVLGLGGSSTSRGREVCVRVLVLVRHGIQRAKREKGMRALGGRPAHPLRKHLCTPHDSCCSRRCPYPATATAVSMPSPSAQSAYAVGCKGHFVSPKLHTQGSLRFDTRGVPVSCSP